MNAGIKKYQEITHVDQEGMDDKYREELILKYAPLVKQIAERMAVRLPPNITKDDIKDCLHYAASLIKDQEFIPFEKVL